VVQPTGSVSYTNAVVDQHFIARKRANRLFSVALEEPGLLGIGIDESIAAVVSSDQRFELLGERKGVPGPF
jgi:cyanophycinase